MIRLPGLIENHTSQLTRQRWYHQRFDGTPMFIFAIADAEMLPDPRKPAGANTTARVCFFEGTKADWYLKVSDIENGAESFMQTARTNGAISAEWRNRWREDELTFEKFFWTEINRTDLHTLSEADLFQSWVHYYELVIRRLSSTAIIDHFALGTDVIIHEMIEKETAGKQPAASSSPAHTARAFSELTAPIYQSYATQADIDLLRIATGPTDQSLEDYQSHYFWLKNNYARAHDYSVREIETEVARWKSSGKNLQVELQRLIEHPKENLRRKEELIRRHDLSSFLQNLLRISDDLSAWQDERKRATCLNIALGTKLLTEIATRKGYQLELLKYATGHEIESIFHRSEPAAEELALRGARSVFLTSPQGFYVGTGDQFDVVKRHLSEEEQTPPAEAVQEIRGLTASLGCVRGRARIIASNLEITKVRPGDILVAVMTRPDYMPALRLAGGIVTNEGGITCHAAIISRELGLPCVIATRTATRELRDGDWVEVNANEGKVVILERADGLGAP